jgi:hypothetical protein
MSSDLLAQRTLILQQMAALSSMELGSLKAEFREGPSGEKIGPYYKHQVWEDGGNLSRRVPSEEAPALETAIANRQRFEQLATEFIAITVQLTRQNQSGHAQKKTLRPIVSSLRKRKSRS